MLATLEVDQRPETYAYVNFSDRPDDLGMAAAVIEEPEGTTVIVPVDAAVERGWRIEFEVAWLTLRVHSSLEAVGLTAAISTALATSGIPANILAGTFHDHLLVPVPRATDAVEVLKALRN